MVFSEYTENEEAMVRSNRYKLIVGTGRRERKDHLETGAPSQGPTSGSSTSSTIPTRRPT